MNRSPLNRIERILNDPEVNEEFTFDNKLILGNDHPVSRQFHLIEAASSDTIDSTIITGSTGITGNKATASSVENSNLERSNLRRSGRPKPAAEALISSPPAIKFYESTIVRSKSANSTLKSSATLNNKKLMSEKTVEESPILKLRLPTSTNIAATSTASNKSISNNSSKENITDKRNMRVVKLMMPDITSFDETLDDRRIDAEIRTNRKKSKFSSEKLPPLRKGFKREKIKVQVQVDVDVNVEVSKLNLPAPQPNQSTLPTLEPSKSKTPSTTTPVTPEKLENIINEDVCSSCGGLGNFICCDACPRSFHFTCAEPPLDPQNLPEEDWFCCDCLNKQDIQNSELESVSVPDSKSSDLWTLMRREASKMNPTCFVMPRRFRYQPKEEDLQKLLSGQLIPSLPTTSATPINTQSSEVAIKQASVNLVPSGPIVFNETVKIDHCHPPSLISLKSPNISSLKHSTGYCHCCGLFGLTRTALQKSADDPSIPSDLRLHRPILSCNICPLYWHLDCLDPPLPAFPANSETNWTCPIHFTTEKCLALEISEALVQATLLLPEDAIKRQFEQKINRRRDSTTATSSAATGSVADQDESFYGINPDHVNVPEIIRQFYNQ